jgi:DNA recombination protein RmuC
METLLMLAVGLVLGGVLGWMVGRTPRTESGVDPAVLEARHAAVVSQVRHDEALARAEVEQQLAAARASVEGLREQLVQAQEQHRLTLETHRNEIRQREAAAQGESKVLQKLAPVAAQLKDMQQKVLDLEKQRSQQHGDLAAQIRATRQSAEQSKMAAETLSAALRNNSVRGAYGELQLKTLVESAGLLNRIDYSVQESISADSGARRPDMVIKLPGRKQVAIDSKVPFSAFIDSFREDISETERKSLQAQHAKQVRSHVDALAGKEYWTGLPVSPEYTIAFIPSEAILNTALDADPTLLEYAFGRGIVLATPVNLWATLKTVALTWKQEDLAENAQELVDLGRELYKRLGKLSEHVSKLGRSIETTVRSYNDFAGSLEGRVLVTARKLDGIDEARLLGEVKQIEGDTRRLTASEFTALEQTGIARPEIDFEQVGLPIADDDERTA